MHHILISLGGIIILGIVAQWVAWRIKFSPVLLLLLFGILAGPVTGLLDPTHLFGDLLFPSVSLAVAVILFEGGLTLKLSELSAHGRTVSLLLVIGTLVTWIMVAFFAILLFQFPLAEATLLGALLSVTGPTVIQPLLKHVKPRQRVRTVLKWEGIVIDPLGAMLAILVFETMHANSLYETPYLIVMTVLKMLLLASLVGLLAAALVTLLMKNYWLPDHLHNPFALATMLAAFIGANSVQEEAGLVAVTVMGLALANQPFVSVRHIVQFKEDLRVLILSGLFIVLAARLQFQHIQEVGFYGAIFVLFLVVIIRPVSVLLATIKTPLNLQERLFIGSMAPRGIVAAAVSSLMAFKLNNAHLTTESTHLLEPLTYMVIIGTVLFYSMASNPLANWLGVRPKKSDGLLIVGAHRWAREFALFFQDQGFQVLLVDSNRGHIQRARLLGLKAYYGSALSEHIFEDINFDGLGYALCVTSNDEVNSLACVHLSELFERSEVYQLMPRDMSEQHQKHHISEHFAGRFLFDQEMTYEELAILFQRDYQLKATQLSTQFTFEKFQAYYHGLALPLAMRTPEGKLLLFSTTDIPLQVPEQALLFSLVPHLDKPAKTTRQLAD